MGPDFLPPTCRLCCGQEGPTWTHCFDLSWLESTARDGDRSRPHCSSQGLGKQLADFAPAVAALRSLMALKTILAPEGADRPCFPLKWAPSRGQDSRAGLCSCLGGGASPRPGCSAIHSDWDVYQELCPEPTARPCRECGQMPVTGPGHLKASAALCQQRWPRQALSGLFRVLGSGLSLTTAHCSSRHSHPTVIPLAREAGGAQGVQGPSLPKPPAAPGPGWSRQPWPSAAECSLFTCMGVCVLAALGASQIAIHVCR